MVGYEWIHPDLYYIKLQLMFKKVNKYGIDDA